MCVTKRLLPFLILAVQLHPVRSQPVQVQIDIQEGRKPVSPYLYGRNNSLSVDPKQPVPTENWLRYREAKVRFFRENTGNNATKYNWRRKLSSHPDWYNNVYPNDWDFAAQSLQSNLPTAQGMWAFQLIGKAAKTNAYNFNDWGYNKSQWWTGVNQNLAGDGLPNTTGGNKALTEGNPALYLENWPADSTVGLLDHWFGTGGLGLNKSQIQYWNMDNEAEIWSGTHDDVMPKQLTADEFIQRYVEVAQKARARFPAIKLVGPVTANEWQWYNYDNKPVTDANGQKYPWLEFFIKRIAEEQKRTGLRLLDVLDIHFYPSSTKAEEVVQFHRVFFDRNYVFPEANGVRTSTGGYDTNLNREFIFGRCLDWLEKYMGTTHGVRLALTEAGLNEANNANVHAIWYASTLGEFMNNSVEIFAPWSWRPGMWEVLHLFSRYNQSTRIEAISGTDGLVSAYATANEKNDSLTVVLINRSTTAEKPVNVGFKNFIIGHKTPNLRLLSNLPATETFVSHSNNALKTSTVQITNNAFSILLPPLSIALVQLQGQAGTPTIITALANAGEPVIQVNPNPAIGQFQLKTSVKGQCEVYDLNGRQIGKFATTDGFIFGDSWPSGVYIAVFSENSQFIKSVKLIKD